MRKPRQRPWGRPFARRLFTDFRQNAPAPRLGGGDLAAARCGVSGAETQGFGPFVGLFGLEKLEGVFPGHEARLAQFGVVGDADDLVLPIVPHEADVGDALDVAAQQQEHVGLGRALVADPAQAAAAAQIAMDVGEVQYGRDHGGVDGGDRPGGAGEAGHRRSLGSPGAMMEDCPRIATETVV
ncbi:hypothetical protein CC_1094 [Caulobacter vibrioides CB15]|uniref:Uncharacterized protein n=1 Tax=Caulobacter vibrioides (strain ATCC 19089 / CIP 103742 / CB 15) TaxID=190650 RepID=Q9A9A0_CAUVC|nr:hypothetical protein CC_1094 [Caulobacter vibrioides CB15]